ncbi:MAG: glutamate--tRNA ligase family protein [Nitrospira sp.]|nr:glutamate--tRNA ligase family protein [Nitrospira sp.]
MSQVGVRFAPSPTGFLHIGGVRTALFSWLFARQQNGVFILRIEEHRPDRSTDASIQAILDGMRWVKLDWDEGPFRQTDRMDLYRSHAFRLFEQGHAYWCVCRPEELEARRKTEAKADRLDTTARCRNLGLSKPPGDAALRFKARRTVRRLSDPPRGGWCSTITFWMAIIVLRSNGFPTYNFSVVVDDALMGITHVVRGTITLRIRRAKSPYFRPWGSRCRDSDTSR